MKKLILAFICLSVFSCNSPRKLLSSGNDLQVINQVLKKEVKRKAKQEDIEYLERAFSNYQNARMQSISEAQRGGGEKKWAVIAKEAKLLIDIQNHIQKQMPIRARNGYRAKIQFEDVSEVYVQSSKKASIYHKTKGESLLDAALSKENVHYARDAYVHLLNAQKYDSTLELDDKIEQAKQLGTVRVLTSVHFPFWRSFYYRGLSKNDAERQLIRLLERPRGTKWVHIIKPNSRTYVNKDIDYEIRLSMVDFDVSNGYSSTETKTYNKQIEEVAKDKNGKPISDKDGKPIKTYRNVEAHIERETRYQEGEVKLEYKLIRLSDQNVVYSQYLSEQEEVEREMCKIRGDRRALPSSISCNQQSTEISEEDLFRELIDDIQYDFDRVVKQSLKDF